MALKRGGYVRNRHIPILGALKQNLRHIVLNTGVSVMPSASFASVLPVQGATTSTSNIFLGPIGSVVVNSWSTVLPVISYSRAACCCAVPKRVSREYALWDIIGVTSQPSDTSSSSCSNTLANVQNEPQTANPTRSPESLSISLIRLSFQRVVCYWSRFCAVCSLIIAAASSAMYFPAAFGEHFPGSPPAKM